MITNLKTRQSSVFSISQTRRTLKSAATARLSVSWSRLACVGLMLVAAAAAGSLVMAGNQTSAASGNAENRASQSDDEADHVASALLRISFREPRVLSDRNDAHSASKDEFEMYRRTQSVLIKTGVVVGPALRRPEVSNLGIVQKHKDDPVAWLAEAIRVDFPGDAEILRISLRGDKPEELVTLINAVVDAFMSEVADAGQARRLRHIGDLEKLLAQSEQAVQTKRATLRAITERVGASESSNQMALEYFAALKSEFARVRIELLRAQARLRVQQAAGKLAENAQPADSPIDDLIDSDPSVRQELDRVARTKERLAEIARVSKDDAALVARNREQLEFTQASLVARRAEARSLIRRAAGRKLPVAEVARLRA